MSRGTTGSRRDATDPGAGGQIRQEAGQTGEGGRVGGLACLGTGRGKETGTGRRGRAGTAGGEAVRNTGQMGAGAGVGSLESLQFRSGTGIPEQEVMGHRSDPGPSTLEVTAAAVGLATNDWSLPGGVSLRASLPVSGAGDQVLRE